ncbi:MAG: hypothetical protein JWQ32_2066 [Marmoricola sp.]|nr:hypothetical protein [Marmoricola sp.]
MSTDPSTAPDAAAPATTDPALSSPVPAPEQTPAPALGDASPTAPADASPSPATATDPNATAAPAAPADPQAGDVKTLTTEDSDGFVIETPCLVLDTFEHDDAEGNTASFAHVVVLPPASVIKTARLS